MSKIVIVTIVALTAALAGTVYAGPPGRGGGGGGHPGGGGAPHAVGGGGMPHAMGGGGGAPHIGGGGAPHFAGGAPHGGGGGAPHFSGGGPRFGGGHVGGAPHFAGRPATSHFAARPNAGDRHSFAVHAGRTSGPTLNGHRDVHVSRDRNAPTSARDRAANVKPNTTVNPSARTNAVRNALNSRAVAGALHNPASLRSAHARAQIAATAATAGWHDGRGEHGWWRHRHGGFGWVGPVFWPFAYYDLYDYTLWGYGYDDPFWDYGYNDIYAGIFSPYGYDDLAGYWPQEGGGGSPMNARAEARETRGTKAAAPEQIAQMCGEDSRDIAGLPIDQIQAAIAPNDTQRAALDALANASAKAAETIKAACPTKIALTAPARLAAMQQRIEAMIAAVDAVRPPLQKFYDLLSDEQKVRLNALGQDQARTNAAKTGKGSLAENCGAAQTNVTAWPSAEIDAKVHPTDAQRASLTALQDATAKAADLLKTSCPANEEVITPTARLDAVHKRLEAMLQAVKTVHTALDDFYGRLSDEQKAQFEAIGQRRSAEIDPPSAARTHVAHVRHHHFGYGGIIRRLMSMARW
jgi:LTXXQ motif family protein